MPRSHPLRLASGLALASTLAFSSAAVAQDDIVGHVEQTLRDYAVAAYEAVEGFLADVESSVTDATSGVLETAQADLAAIEERLAGALDHVVDCLAPSGKHSPSVATIAMRTGWPGANRVDRCESGSTRSEPTTMGARASATRQRPWRSS